MHATHKFTRFSKVLNSCLILSCLVCEGTWVDTVSHSVEVGPPSGEVQLLSGGGALSRLM